MSCAQSFFRILLMNVKDPNNRPAYRAMISQLRSNGTMYGGIASGSDRIRADARPKVEIEKKPIRMAEARKQLFTITSCILVSLLPATKAVTT